MTETNSSYFVEIGGDFKSIEGDISGGVINQYIITEKSGIEIISQPLIKKKLIKLLIKMGQINCY